MAEVFVGDAYVVFLSLSFLITISLPGITTNNSCIQCHVRILLLFACNHNFSKYCNIKKGNSLTDCTKNYTKRDIVP